MMKKWVKKVFKSGSLFNKLYYGIPMKKQLFTLLRSTGLIPESLQWYLRFKGPFEVKVNDLQSFKMYHPGFYIENNLFWKGFDRCWERESLKVWAKLAANSKVIFDVGANTGTYSLTAKAVHPSARVYAFEPLSRMKELVKQNAKLNDFDIRIISKAVGDFDGQATFFDVESADGDVSSASLSENFKKSESQKPLEVEVIKLSSFIQQEKIERLDLIKIDVETFEPQVLKGLAPFLKEYKPSLLIEILTDDIAREVESLISGLDYLFFDIVPGQGLIQKQKIAKSAYFNYLLCQKEVAQFHQLI